LLPELERHVLAGHLTGGCKRNQAYLDDKVRVATSVSATLREAAYDPQTSGGLLIAVAAKEAERLLEDLAALGVPDARAIGRARRRGPHWVELG
jgi:selenide,water dikinase